MKNILYTGLIWIWVLLGATEVAAQYDWVEGGPNGFGSRTRTLLFNGSTLYAGSATGGLWQTTNEGASWSRTESYTGNTTITSMASGNERIYIGTGETSFIAYGFSRINGDVRIDKDGFLGYTGLPGGGVYVSSDNGQTWSNTNAVNPNGVAILLDGPFLGINKVGVAPSGRIFIACGEGLYYSDDPDLGTITKCLGSPIFESLPVLDFDISENGTVFAGTSGNIPNDSLYISRDGGVTFEAATDPTLYSISGALSFQRIEVEIPEGTDIVYVGGTRNSGELQILWRSDDNGQPGSWSQYAPGGAPEFSPLGTGGRSAFVLESFPSDPNKLIIAGSAFFTYSEEEKADQPAQSFFPGVNSYVPAPIYTVVFDPNDENTFYIGTENEIIRSSDGGQTFDRRSKGYNTTSFYGVAAVTLDEEDALVGGSIENGTIYNFNYTALVQNLDDRNVAEPRGFGTILGADAGKVATSYLYPEVILAQASDNGLELSNTFGGAFDRFYSLGRNTSELKITNLVQSDTIIDRADNAPNVSNATTGVMRDNGKLSPVSQFVLDEYIPEELIGNQEVRRDSLQKLDSYIFFCSSDFVWMVSYPTGNPNGLLPRWNRITNRGLLDGDEYFTAITVSGDETHTVFVGTSKGQIFRITGITDTSTVYDASLGGQNVQAINANIADPRYRTMEGRWITDIAIDPTDTDRMAITYASYGGNTAQDRAFSFLWEAINIYSTTSPPRFTSRRGNLPPTERLYSAEFAEKPDGSGSVLFVGGESGLYSTDDFSATTPDYQRELGPENMGREAVYDIYVRRYQAQLLDEATRDFYLEKDNRVFVGTNGRGIWFTGSLEFQKGTAGDNVEVTPQKQMVKLVENPSVGGLSLKLVLPNKANVTSRLIGIDGRVIENFAPKIYEAGVYTTSHELSGIPSGVYLVEVTIDQAGKVTRETLKAVLVN
ncbi:MAG: hypothetical protein AAGI38_03910 [Bacteroidota bacterium]